MFPDTEKKILPILKSFFFCTIDEYLPIKCGFRFRIDTFFFSYVSLPIVPVICKSPFVLRCVLLGMK